MFLMQNYISISTFVLSNDDQSCSFGDNIRRSFARIIIAINFCANVSSRKNNYDS